MKRQLILCGLCVFTFACERNKAVTEESAPPPATPVVIVTNAEQVAPQQTAPKNEQVDRGKYLVTIGGCNDCHTTKKMGPKGPELDTSRLLAGHSADEKLPPPPKPVGPWAVAATGTLTAWSGPWGKSYAANLTPDRDTGLGQWSEDQFIRAMRTGKHQGGPGTRDILPPMPSSNYAVMTDADLKAVFAFLRSIPAVANAVLSPEPPPAMPGNKGPTM
jgi:mono/diheme cytochrome c family protein